MRALSTKVPLRRRGPGGREAVDRLLDAEQPARPGVLEVGAHGPELDGPGDGAADLVRGVAVAGFEVRGHGNAHRGHDATDVLEHRVAVQRSSVRDPAGPGDARAGRGDGREADLLEDAGGPGVPGVGEHEAGTRRAGRGGRLPCRSKVRSAPTHDRPSRPGATAQGRCRRGTGPCGIHRRRRTTYD